MSILRVGMSESKSYGDGYEAIFGKKKPAAKPATPKPTAKKKPAKKAKKA